MDHKQLYIAGNGTKEQPYEIWTEEEFIQFSLHCVKEIEYLYYVLKNDLDLSAYLWKPIGAEESQLENRKWRRGFCGSFDGGMHHINGIKLEAPTQPGELHCFGLFAMLGAYEDQQTLQTKVTNLQLQYDSQSLVLMAQDTYFGGLSGLVYNSLVEHCLVSGNVIFLGREKGLYAGGIGGILRDSSVWEKERSASIIDSSFHGTLIATIDGKENPKVYLGGIIGSIQSKQCEINHCFSHAFLHGSFTGKMAGSIMEGTVRE